MNNKMFPSVFGSHGAPSLVIKQNDTVTFLKRLVAVRVSIADGLTGALAWPPIALAMINNSNEKQKRREDVK